MTQRVFFVLFYIPQEERESTDSGRPCRVEKKLYAQKDFCGAGPGKFEQSWTFSFFLTSSIRYTILNCSVVSKICVYSYLYFTQVRFCFENTEYKKHRKWFRKKGMINK